MVGCRFGVPRLLRISPGLDRLADLDRQEKGQKISDAASPAPWLDWPRLPVCILFLRADPLDELKERCLLSCLSEQYHGRENLKQQVIALNIHQHIVPNNLQICGLAKVITEKLVQVPVPRAHDVLQNRGCGACWQC